MILQQTAGENSIVTLEIKMPAEEFDIVFKKAAAKLSRQVNIPGFRKGKAPEAVVESFVGAPAIIEEAMEEALPKAYWQAVDESGIEPVSKPEIGVIDMGKGKDLHFKASVTVKPEVTLGEYKGVSVVKEVYQIADKDVDEALNSKRARLAKLQPAAEGTEAQEGDSLNIDFLGKVDGVPFPGGEAHGYPLEIGSNTFIPGFEPQLIGAKAGDEKDITVTFPEDYHEDSLKGKEAVFTVKVNSLLRKELPEWNEELVQELSETANTLEELREQTRAELQEQSTKMADESIRGLAIHKAMDNAAVEIPQIMIENRIDDQIEDMSQRLEQQGFSMEMYLGVIKKTPEELREEYREYCTTSVKMDLVLGAVARAEGMTVSEEEIDEQIAGLASETNKTAAEIKERLAQTAAIMNLKEGILLSKAGNFVAENAVVEEKSVSGKEE
ncbi:MAG: trigger factor [Clostridia bacterium]|nr:trigger factor [Clostridia bacterium]MDD4799380.1 trigger factor [Clostridia bacterium]